MLWSEFREHVSERIFAAENPTGSVKSVRKLCFIVENSAEVYLAASWKVVGRYESVCLVSFSKFLLPLGWVRKKKKSLTRAEPLLRSIVGLCAEFVPSSVVSTGKTAKKKIPFVCLLASSGVPLRFWTAFGWARSGRNNISGRVKSIFPAGCSDLPVEVRNKCVSRYSKRWGACEKEEENLASE